MGAEPARSAQQLSRNGHAAARFGALALLAASTGCLGDFLTTPGRSGQQPSGQRRLVVMPDSVTVDAFEATARFTAGWQTTGSLSPAAGCAWSIGDLSVARVDEHGNVRATGNGTTSVRATCAGTTAVAVVRVRQAVAAVVVDPDAMELDMGESDVLRAVARDPNGHVVTRPLAFGWSSSNAMRVSVAADARSPGQAEATRYFPGAAEVRATAEGKIGRVVVEDDD